MCQRAIIYKWEISGAASVRGVGNSAAGTDCLVAFGPVKSILVTPYAIQPSEWCRATRRDMQIVAKWPIAVSRRLNRLAVSHRSFQFHAEGNVPVSEAFLYVAKYGEPVWNSTNIWEPGRLAPAPHGTQECMRRRQMRIVPVRHICR
jgi:hypothetical protein